MNSSGSKRVGDYPERVFQLGKDRMKHLISIVNKEVGVSSTSWMAGIYVCELLFFLSALAQEGKPNSKRVTMDVAQSLIEAVLKAAESDGLKLTVVYDYARQRHKLIEDHGRKSDEA